MGVGPWEGCLACPFFLFFFGGGGGGFLYFLHQATRLVCNKYMIRSTDPRTEPCGTPGSLSDVELLTQTAWYLLHK